MTPMSTADPVSNTGDIDPLDARDQTLVQDTNSLARKANAGDAESDYSDIGEDEESLTIIDHLLSQAAAWQGQNAPLLVDVEDYEAPKGVHLPKILGLEQTTRSWQPSASHAVRDSKTTDPGTIKSKDGTLVSDRRRERSISAEPEAQPSKPDTRSPLERFRRPPKKALSVTDLISPSWCELQYFYTLTKHGRKKRTPAMKQGTVVHEALEREVHVTVPVEILKEEDSWGLRIWNIIQGLRTLRDTGRTRELEIWGTISGEIVNGVIDELSYTCPDPKLEEESEQTSGTVDGSRVLPEYQRSITEYLLSTGGHKTEGQSMTDALHGKADQSLSHQKTKSPEEKRIYITDVKTRGSATLPTGASIRPTVLQLHLYHHMLENLVQGNFTLDQLTDRYGLDPDETFSDSFIAQIGSLNQDLFDVASSQGATMQIASSQDSMDILLRHNNLASLWEFMMSQFRITFLHPVTVDADPNEPPTPTPQSTSDIPPPASLPTRLSPLLTAEYLSPNYKHQHGTGKKAIGSKSFIFNSSFLRSYLEDNLTWWRGEREARGVELQEAWKCRSCEFRDDCAWIHERDREAVEEVKSRKERSKGVGKSTV